jgi:CubicO group peptidase (beta-lactamase class C family)
MKRIIAFLIDARDKKDLSMKTDLLYRVYLAALLAALSVGLVPARAQNSTPPSSKAIEAALQPFVESHALAGAVTLVADKNKILSLDAVGYADVAAKTPLRTNALFWIASQSKPITAAALMILVDEGKVRLGDPVEKYLPEFKEQRLAGEPGKLVKPQQTVTVRHVLSHTSGLPFKSAQETPTLDALPLREAVGSYAKTPLQTEPGAKYQYSNAGINTAGRIIEVVSGMPYEEFLDKRLFAPLGMKDTTFWPNQEQLARLAKSYKPNKTKSDLDETTISQLRYPLHDRTRGPMPAGGLFSTATDVAHFCQMMLNGGAYHGQRILSEEAVKELTRDQTGPLKKGYGLGFSTNAGGFGHGGAYATNMTVDTKRGLITVFMVQHAGFPGNGSQSQAAFRSAAEREFGALRK